MSCGRSRLEIERTSKLGFQGSAEEGELGVLESLEDVCGGDRLFTSVHGVFVGTTIRCQLSSTQARWKMKRTARPDS